MKLSDIIKAAGLFFTCLVFIAAIVLVAYNGINMEYKYTAKVSCYDKHDSLIENTTCGHEVYCGPWQESTPFRRGSLPCNDAIVSGDEQ